MKRIVLILGFLMLGLLAFQSCEKKKPNNPDLERPGYYFPINLEYTWTYVHLNTQCEVSQDSFKISAVTRKTRYLGEYGWESGWDLVSATGGTTFVYHKGDTIFNFDVGSTPYPAKVLVGPIRQGTFWEDDREFEYSILGFEDIYSEAAGGVYRRCARIRRTMNDDPRKADFWWAPQIGKVRRAYTNQGGQCESGEELRRLDKNPEFP